MAVFILHSMPEAIVDSRYIDAIDLTITNSGNKVYDVLVELSNSQGLLFLGLFEALPGVEQCKPSIPTLRDAFKLLIVTNVNTYGTMNVMITAKREGETVAIFTQEDCERLN